MNTNLVINIAAFAILTILWLGFGATLVFNRELLDTIWASYQGLPLVLRIVIGLLVLPVILGLWIWESPWPVWLRLVLVIGLGVATIYIFFPKQS